MKEGGTGLRKTIREINLVHKRLTHFPKLQCCVSVSLVRQGNLRLGERVPCCYVLEVTLPFNRNQLGYQYYYRALVHVVGYQRVGRLSM